MNIKKQVLWSVGVTFGLFLLLMVASLVMVASIPKGDTVNKSIDFIGIHIMGAKGTQDGFEVSSGLGIIIIPVIVGLLTFVVSFFVQKLAKGGPEL